MDVCSTAIRLSPGGAHDGFGGDLSGLDGLTALRDRHGPGKGIRSVETGSFPHSCLPHECGNKSRKRGELLRKLVVADCDSDRVLIRQE